MRRRSAYVIAAHRLLHMNVALGASHRTLLYPFLIRPVFLILCCQLFQILPPVLSFHSVSFRRILGRFRVLND